MLTADSPVRLIVADDHFATRRGLKDFLFHQNDIEVMSTAANGKEVLDALRVGYPHIVLTDVKMPVMDGRELCRILHQQYPDVKVIAYTMFDGVEAIVDMRKAGASGYVSKMSHEDELLKAIFSVHGGGEYYCAAIRKRIDTLFETGRFGFATEEKKQTFSATELKIIKLICHEKSSKEIACELNLSKRTVEHYQEKIRVKMGVHSAVGIAMHAVMNWLLY